MSLEYDQVALSEVHYVLTFLDEKSYSKIPSNLINYIRKNMDKKIEITEEMIKDDNILPDAQELLSLIYTEYLYDEKQDGPMFDKEEEESIRRKQAELYEAKMAREAAKRGKLSKDYSNRKKKNRKDKREKKKGKKSGELQTGLIVKKETLFEKIIKNINKVIQNMFDSNEDEK